MACVCDLLVRTMCTTVCAKAVECYRCRIVLSVHRRSYCIVSIVTSLLAGPPRNHVLISGVQQKNCIFLESTQTAMYPPSLPSPPIQWLPKYVFPEVKQPGREDGQLDPVLM
jgi:hypothetical protein